MNEGTNKIADQEWFSQPVEIQVERDNISWLESLKEMNQKELIDFAIYRYQVPEGAAKVVNRSELVQMIVVSNKAGGGGSVLRTRFQYLEGLSNIPQYTQKIRGGRKLYLTRGDGDTMQVFNKATGEWVSGRGSRPFGNVGRSPAPEMAPGPIEQNTEPKPQSDAGAVDVKALEREAQIYALRLMEPSLHRLKREELENIVRALGEEETGDDKFPAVADLLAYIRKQIGTEEGGKINATAEGANTPPPQQTNKDEGSTQ